MQAVVLCTDFNTYITPNYITNPIDFFTSKKANEHHKVF